MLPLIFFIHKFLSVNNIFNMNKDLLDDYRNYDIDDNLINIDDVDGVDNIDDIDYDRCASGIDGIEIIQTDDPNDLLVPSFFSLNSTLKVCNTLDKAYTNAIEIEKLSKERNVDVSDVYNKSFTDYFYNGKRNVKGERRHVPLEESAKKKRKNDYDDTLESLHDFAEPATNSFKLFDKEFNTKLITGLPFFAPTFVPTKMGDLKNAAPLCVKVIVREIVKPEINYMNTLSECYTKFQNICNLIPNFSIDETNDKIKGNNLRKLFSLLNRSLLIVLHDQFNKILDDLGGLRHKKCIDYVFAYSLKLIWECVARTNDVNDLYKLLCGIYPIFNIVCYKSMEWKYQVVLSLASTYVFSLKGHYLPGGIHKPLNVLLTPPSLKYNPACIDTVENCKGALDVLSLSLIHI
jgi:hypothetical protein